MALKEEKVYGTSGKKKASVRRETGAVSGVRVMTIHKIDTHPPKSTPKAAPPSEPSMTRGRKAEVRLAEFFDNCADTV